MRRREDVSVAELRPAPLATPAARVQADPTIRPLPGGARILALQRTAGNRAVTAWLDVRKAVSVSADATVQRDKTKHDFGDLHYGVSDPHYQGYLAMTKKPEPPGADPDDDPVSVDTLNDQAKITEKMNEPDDTPKGYFAAMDLVDASTHPVNSPASGSDGSRS